MKVKWSISFNAFTVPGGEKTILEPIGCSDVAKVVDDSESREIYVRLELDDGDARRAKLYELLRKYHLEVREYDYIEYEDDDLQSARLLWMSCAVREHISAGRIHGTKYDMTAACPNCAAGARQTSVLYIDGDDEYDCEGTDWDRVRKHRAIGSWNGEIIVDGGMVKKLKDAGVTGISFGDVRARRKNNKWRMVARDQILIAHTMPPMRVDLATENPKYLCKVCKRGGRSLVPDKPYRQEDLESMQDFNLTWEWFGEFWPKDEKKKRNAKWPSPSVLVTPKVMNIFRGAGVETFQWTPVFVEE